MTEKDTIVEFAAAGPQNYGYQTRQVQVECKVRGFSLNVRGKEQLNFDLLKQNVLDEIRLPQDKPHSIPIFNSHKITRDAHSKQLLTLIEIKKIQNRGRQESGRSRYLPDMPLWFSVRTMDRRRR